MNLEIKNTNQVKTNSQLRLPMFPITQGSILPLLLHKYLLRRIIYKKYIYSEVCVTKETNQNINPDQKEVLKRSFRSVHILLQQIKWFVRTDHVKVQGNTNTVVNYAIPI